MARKQARIWPLVLGLVAALCLPAAARPVTVALLGDSLTQGYGLPQGDGLVPVLQAWLDAHGEDAVILNAGVSGDTTAGGLSRIDWTLAPGVQGLIVALGGNDLLRGLPPGAARANLDAILDRAEGKGVPVLLIGVAAPGNFGPEYKAAFDAIWPELAAAHGTLLVADMLAPLTADPQKALRDYMQADGIHPNAAGVRLVVEAIGPKVAELAGRIRARQ